MSKTRLEVTKNRPKILCAPTHERYQSYFSDLPFDFYLFSLPTWKKWDTQFSEVPQNHTLINSITPDIMPDVILAQEKQNQFPLFAEVSRNLSVPLISLTHILPHSRLSLESKYKFLSMGGTYNVYLSEFSRQMWGDDGNNVEIIKQCVDSDFWKPSSTKMKNSILSVVNEYDIRGEACNYQGWLDSTKGLPTKIIGNSTSGISSPAPSLESLRDSYSAHKVFLNTSKASTFPFTLFEAMACGACVVSSATSMIPDVIDHGRNGFLYDVNRPNDAKELLTRLLSFEEETIREIGARARETVVKNFSKAQFTESWKNLINKAINENTHNIRSA